MGIKCPKCNFDNPETATFCADCGTKISLPKDVDVTETLETPKEELIRGTILANRYEIIEELGKGGMGRVYRVEDTKLKQEVAFKLIKPEIARDKKTIERFRNELKLARNIRHKNVCGMFDLGETEGAHFITMEYVRGEDLKSFIHRSGQLAVGTTVRIAKQVCEGLSEAHKLGVVHRDLKSNNIMIDKEGNVRIMDFGIARSLEGKRITGAGVMIGTPEYMSPEQVEGKETDQRSDIYSLGVILYEMVTGRVPFVGDTPFTVGMKHKGEIPTDPKELNTQIPDDLSRMILRCLEKEKEKRYQSAGEVRSELQNIEKGIPTTERVIPERKPLTSREITVQFSLKKMFIPAFVVIAFVITGIIIWQLLPQKEVMSAPKIENSIAVVSFENQTGDKAYDHLKKVIPNLLITNLENAGYLHVATWERMRDLLKQMGKGDMEIIDRDLGFELCRMEGIEAIVLGSFAKAGDMFATDVKVLDVESKNLLKSASSRGEGVDSILKKQIDELSREISKGVGIAREEIEESRARLADVTTTSIDAYNYFLRGRDELEKWYFDEARQFLKKAVELDPTFASAYLYLAWTYEFSGDTRARDETFEKAKTYSGKATEKERLFIEGLYAFYVEGIPEKGFHSLKQMAKKYPKEKRAHMFLGTYYGFMRLFNEAIEEYNKALELDPTYGWAMNGLAYTYLDLGDFEKAIEYFKRYASISPGDANPLDSMAELYFRMGRLDEAIAKYKEALEIKPDFGSELAIGYIYALKEDYIETKKWVDQYITMASSPGLRGDGEHWKAFYHYWLGNFDHSLSELLRLLDLAEEIGNVSAKTDLLGTIGWIYYDKGAIELSQKYFKSLFDFGIESYPAYIPDITTFYSFGLGLVDLKQGRIDSAKSRLAKMRALLPEIDTSSKDQAKFLYDILQGEVLLAESSVEQSIAVLEKASPLGRPPPIQSILLYNVPFLKDVLARAYRKNGEIDNAIAEYERLITIDPSTKARCLIHPKYHYRLAKLYEQKGWKGKAIEHYQKFLSLWKDANPEITEVEDAKKRLAGLKSE